LCVIAAYLPPRAPRMVLTSGALVLAALGAAAAVYQHVVAAKLYSCNLTLADTIISALRLEALLPALFQITGSCADAAVSVLGVPFEYWSLLLFILLALAAASVLIRRHTD
ncbi:MAG: disulfide bond formation protein B, partial [Burkholderiaceae bacterium]|nr:disulfide bond formation protein B [Burkholderiaceae bacterium]